MRKRYRALAQVVKTHGKRGEVVAIPVHGLSSVITSGMRVVPVPPSLTGPREYEVGFVASDQERGCLISLEGVTSIKDAEALVGKTLLVCESDLPEDFELHDRASLLAREVVDKHFGSLGTITDVLVLPAHDVWVVTGSKGEILIPVVDAFIRDVSAGKAICVEIPSSLIEQEEGDDA